MLKKIVFSFLLLSVSSVSSFALAEMAFRYYMVGFEPEFYSGFRGAEAENLVKNAYPVELNQDLGWIPSIKYNHKENIYKTELNILEDTTRSNGSSGNLKPGCEILAVGDSFTFGDEVSDQLSWPAFLERNRRCRVFNGGAPGYGVDQSYLRALQLIETHKPQILILSLIWDDVWRASQDIRQGLPKPYFTYTENALKLHKISDAAFENTKRYTSKPIGSWSAWLRKSFILHRIVDLVAPNYWPGNENHYVGEKDEVVVCHLMQDLDRRAREKGIKFYMVAQYYDDEFKAMNSEMPKLIKCLKGTPVKIIDTFPAVKAVEKNLYAYYFRPFSHMTPRGNELIAQIIAKGLADSREKK